ncbi:MAG TPA: TIM barrel protein [Terriglobales bacterium]|jgi:hydroxypyruvate isomerase|nr:TIM barrel protein [Terriglobales bacterium]
MNRRNFARTMAGAALGATLPPLALAGDADLPFKLSVMLWTVYKQRPFEQRLEKVAEAGYRAVELVDEFKQWSDDNFRSANARKRSLGITFDATAGVWKGVADPGGREAFLSDLKAFFPVAEKLECPAVIVLSGNRMEGVSREAHHAACIEALKPAADMAAKQNVTLLLENIDQEENPRYYLTSVAEGFEIIRQVGHPHVKFLYDFYHAQISEGNLIEKLEKNIDRVGLVHIADVPGRHEPGTGEINYANIFRKLAELKYDRYAAMEFMPSGDPVAELRSARGLVVQAVAASGGR